jgi:hypothetical protein
MALSVFHCQQRLPLGDAVRTSWSIYYFPIRAPTKFLLAIRLCLSYFDLALHLFYAQIADESGVMNVIVPNVNSPHRSLPPWAQTRRQWRLSFSVQKKRKIKPSRGAIFIRRRAQFCVERKYFHCVAVFSQTCGVCMLQVGLPPSTVDTLLCVDVFHHARRKHFTPWFPPQNFVNNLRLYKKIKMSLQIFQPNVVELKDNGWCDGGSVYKNVKEQTNAVELFQINYQKNTKHNHAGAGGARRFPSTAVLNRSFWHWRKIL